MVILYHNTERFTKISSIDVNLNLYNVGQAICLFARNQNETISNSNRGIIVSLCFRKCCHNFQKMMPYISENNAINIGKR